MKRRTLAALVCWAWLASVCAAEPPVLLHAQPTTLSSTLHNGDRVGQVRLLGLLELPGVTIDGLRLAELSDLAWDEDEQILYALSDKGVLFWLRPVFRGQELVDVAAFKAVRLREFENKKPVKGARADSEGLDIVRGHNGRKGDTELLVSFERFPRIIRYRPDGTPIADHPLPPALRNIKDYDDPNKALEAVAIHPSAGIITAPEAPLKTDPPGYTRLFSLGGKSWLYPAEPNSYIVSMKAASDGALLILERDYKSVFGRTRIALKRVTLKGTGPRKVEILARLDSGESLSLDNFEGLTAYRGNRFFLVSDNNDMFFQRTLLLYFELRP
jgi:hypothetical protein